MNQHRPRKRFGQHFLVDTALVDQLVRTIAPAAGDCLVEIGPGEGVLTRALLDRVAHLHLVELDRDLIEGLSRTIAPERATIHSADALRFDFRALAPPGGDLRVVGNLPYNISTPLLFHLLEQAEVIRDMHFMLQKEVVERLVAGPESPRRGRLSVMIQYHCQVDYLLDVPPGAFRPPPRVNSAVVRLSPHRNLPCPAEDYGMFVAVVRQAFTQRRKTIRNALKSWLNGTQIEAAGVDPGVRPDRLELSDFVALADMATRGDA